MSQNTIEVTNRIAMRTTNIKGRKEGFVPAVVYGPKQESTSLFIKNKFFIFNGTRNDDNTIYTLKGVLDGTKVMIKKIAKNPLGSKINHVDLYALDMTKSVKVEVELNFQGEPEAVKEGGGLLQTLRRTIEMECPASAIPKSINVDISSLKIGDTLKMGDITVDPKYTVISAPEYAVISVTEPKADDDETTETVEASTADADSNTDTSTNTDTKPK